MSHKKLDEFYSAMKEKGYNVRAEKTSENYHVVTKDGYHHIAVKEIVILDAPIDYSVKFVEHEFEKLEKEVTQ